MPIKKRRGLFITLEGADGSGKSTQIRRLADRLKQSGFSVVTTREPGGGGKNSLAEKIRELVLAKHQEPVTREAELLLFLAARAQHVGNVILPALERGSVVLCERFSDATWAYQVGGRGLPEKLVGRVDQFARRGVKPDRTLLLKVSARDGLKRAFQVKSGHDRIESESLKFHQKVGQAYAHQAQREPGRIHVMDAEQPAEKVARDIWKDVSRLLEKRGLRPVCR
jgi:dTMP kinase